MGRVNRVEITLGLSWLLIAACGGSGATMEEMPQNTQSTGGTTAPSKPTMSTAAGAMASAGVMRAIAKIQPIMLAPAMSASTTPAAGAAGTTAAAAGTAAAAAGTGGSTSASAAGSGGTAGSSASTAGSGGAAGTGRGAGIAAGSGGAGGTSAAAGSAATGTAGMAASTSAAGAGAAGMAATTAPTTGAAGMTAASGASGAGGAQAPASITGSASFSSNATGVNLSVMVSGCQSGKEYPIHVHQGMSCESAMAQGGHWDMTRGEGIPNIVCGGRMGATQVMRAKTDAATAWSVGDGSATDVIGHVVVIHDADEPTQRIACGVITKN